jgi:hypothetical protein
MQQPCIPIPHCKSNPRTCHKYKFTYQWAQIPQNISKSQLLNMHKCTQARKQWMSRVHTSSNWVPELQMVHGGAREDSTRKGLASARSTLPMHAAHGLGHRRRPARGGLLLLTATATFEVVVSSLPLSFPHRSGENEAGSAPIAVVAGQSRRWRGERAWRRRSCRPRCGRTAAATSRSSPLRPDPGLPSRRSL